MATAFQRAVGAGIRRRVRAGMSPQRALAASAREAAGKVKPKKKRPKRRTTTRKRRTRR